jgi:hypothetical protein
MWSIIGLVSFILLVGLCFMEHSKKGTKVKSDEDLLLDYKTNQLKQEIKQAKQEISVLAKENKRFKKKIGLNRLKKQYKSKSDIEILELILEREKSKLKSLLISRQKQ